MRIAYLTSVYARASDSFVRGEVLALRELGHRVDTFSIRRPPVEELVSEEIRREHDSTEYLLAEGLPKMASALLGWSLRAPGRLARCLALCGRLGNPGLRGRLVPFAYLLEAGLLARRLRRLEIEHLHDHIAEGSASVALLASVLSGTPFSFTVHGPEEFERAASLALEEKTRAARFVVAITEFARSQVCRWIDPGLWSKVHVVHCGVDPRFLEAPIEPPGDDRLVTVARLVPQKGLDVLVEALAEVRRRGAGLDLVVIGDGPMRPALARRIAELHLEEAVSLRGWLGVDEVAAEVELAKALVLPSFAEGLPIVLMEAMARGRPVVATRVGGIAELVEPGVNGWLVAPGSVEQLTAALDALASAGKEQTARMGREGAAAVAREHDRLEEARKLAALMGADRVKNR